MADCRDVHLSRRSVSCFSITFNGWWDKIIILDQSNKIYKFSQLKLNRMEQPFFFFTNVAQMVLKGIHWTVSYDRYSRLFRYDTVPGLIFKRSVHYKWCTHDSNVILNLNNYSTSKKCIHSWLKLLAINLSQRVGVIHNIQSCESGEKSLWTQNNSFS